MVHVCICLQSIIDAKFVGTHHIKTRAPPRAPPYTDFEGPATMGSGAQRRCVKSSCVVLVLVFQELLQTPSKNTRRYPRKMTLEVAIKFIQRVLKTFLR